MGTVIVLVAVTVLVAAVTMVAVAVAVILRQSRCTRRAGHQSSYINPDPPLGHLGCSMGLAVPSPSHGMALTPLALLQPLWG